MGEILPGSCSDDKVTICFSSSFDVSVETRVSGETNDAQ